MILGVIVASFHQFLFAFLAGEVVCAGAKEPFDIFVWSLQVPHIAFISVFAGLSLAPLLSTDGQVAGRVFGP